MKNTLQILIIAIFAVLLETGCKKDGTGPRTSIYEPDINLNIETVPTSFSATHTQNFDRYTKVLAPNGKPIHIFAQVNITNEQIVRARSVLEHFLKDLPNSAHGADKSAIANKMTDNNATLLLLNGSDGEFTPPSIDGQHLYEKEMQVEGHSWYINQDYAEHRDATYEEILHLVHDMGIGVDGANSSPSAAPNFQAMIRSAQQNALSNSLWGIGASSWISELTKENSLSQEYLAAVIDVYYGLWGAWTESSTHGMSGLYVAKVRTDIATEDPTGQGLLDNQFFHPYITYNARIDKDFSGTFSLKLDPSLPYTHHARYLKDITLLGDKPTNVIVNTWDNDITGNTGINTIIFTGNAADYTINTDNNITTIQDNTLNRDGLNTVRQVEKLQFLDQTVDL